MYVLTEEFFNDYLLLEMNSSSTSINDALRGHISELATKDTFNKITKEMRIFFSKNDKVLLTNIIGKQLLFNAKTENEILKILKLNKKDVLTILKASPHFKKFDSGVQLLDQMAFAIPLFILASEYKKKKMDEEAEFIYLTTFFKPYASRVSQYFRYGVNEDRMRHTIENISDKFDIRKEGTVLGVLKKAANNSFNNYMKELTSDTLDSEFHTIFNSGVYSRVRNFVVLLAVKYLEHKDYLPFEDSHFSTEDSDTGTEMVSRSSSSDTAVKDALVKRVTNTFIRNPIDQGYITTALKMYKDRNINTPNYRELMKTIISNISETMLDKIPEFFESLVASFLFNINPETGRRYTAEDIKSPVFISSSLQIFKRHNTKDVNQLKVKALLEEMLLNSSQEYLISKTTKRDIIKGSVFFYMLLMTRK